MSTNMQRLGSVLSGNMQRTGRAMIPTTVELGTINGDLSLSVDSLSGKIDPSDYMVDLRLTHDTYKTYETTHQHTGGSHGGHEGGNGQHSHDDGKHDHRVPSVFRRLEAGDRVLVMWVGHEPIIVAVVVSGTTITSN